MPCWLDTWLAALELCQLEGGRGRKGHAVPRRLLLEVAPTPIPPRGWPLNSLGTKAWRERSLYSEWLCGFTEIKSSITKKEGTHIGEQLSNFNRASKIL